MCEFRNITRFLILIIIIFEENIKSKKNLNYFPEIFINLKYEKILKILWDMNFFIKETLDLFDFHDHVVTELFRIMK